MGAVHKNQLGVFSDPHGDFGPLKQVVRSGAPAHSLLLGDYDLDRPLDVELGDLMAAGSSVHWIHGNHDTDRADWYDYTFDNTLSDRNITAKVVEIDGVRVAGLGGVFREGVWHPKDGAGKAVFTTRDDYMAANRRNAWRDGLPLRHRSTIFPEDFNALASLEADILISHEAPSSHKYGHSEIDDLAEVMGVKVIIHGHLHQYYRSKLANGVNVIGLDKAGVLLTSFDELLG